MNISAINNLSSINTSLKLKNLQKTSNSLTQSSYSIAKNTLQEAIGRSMVLPFKGNGQITQDGFLYTQENMLGSLNDRITYNKKTGEFIFEKTLPNGIVKESVKFNPQNGTTISYKLNDNDTTTQTIKTPKDTRTLIKDEQGRRIYFEIENPKGQRKTVETDYDRNREVTQLSAPNIPTKTTVKDLSTGRYVVSGPLVEDRIEVEDGIFETKNIVTGALYKRETYTNKGRTIQITDFSRETGIKTKETIIDKGETDITYFDKNGVRNKNVYTNKKGVKTYTIYAEDGIYETSKVEKTFDKNGKLLRKVTYTPNTDLIENIVEVNNANKSTTTYYFESYPNVCKYSETKVNDVLVKSINYYEDGKKPKKITKYDTNGSYIEELYDKKGHFPKAKTLYYDTNHELYKREEFDTQTGKIFESWEKHPNIDNLSILKMFDYNGILEKKDIIQNERILSERTYYYDDGITPRKIIKYNPDRSYKELEYSRAFKLMSENEYTAYGELKS